MRAFTGLRTRETVCRTHLRYGTLVIKQGRNHHPIMSPPAAVITVPAVALPAEALPGFDREGYLLSSLDLRAGLEMRRVAVAQLPADVLRELLRLRSVWRRPH